MAEPPIEMWEMQLAFAIGLLGVYAGWRGTIARMTGFYDLSGAFKSLLFGLVAGVLIASLIDSLILEPIRLESVNIISVSIIALFIGMAESAFALFLLGRPRTVGLRASAPYGWTLGLGFGAMRSAHLNVRLFDPNVWQGTTGFEAINIVFACIVTLTICIGHASIASWQGSKIIQHERARTFFTSSIARTALIVTTVLSIFNPFIIFLIIQMVIWSWFPAHSTWLPSGMTPAAAQAYRRTLRSSGRHELAAAERIRGKRVINEE
tara:strand:- start:1084 stop:1878 length:795 start_codon:yes stop_codon:yes gene_type:complete